MFPFVPPQIISCVTHLGKRGINFRAWAVCVHRLCSRTLLGADHTGLLQAQPSSSKGRTWWTSQSSPGAAQGINLQLLGPDQMHQMLEPTWLGPLSLPSPGAPARRQRWGAGKTEAFWDGTGNPDWRATSRYSKMPCLSICEGSILIEVKLRIWPNSYVWWHKGIPRHPSDCEPRVADRLGLVLAFSLCSHVPMATNFCNPNFLICQRG